MPFDVHLFQANIYTNRFQTVYTICNSCYN